MRRQRMSPADLFRLARPRRGVALVFSVPSTRTYCRELLEGNFPLAVDVVITVWLSYDRFDL